jgi:hypothetical protein
LEHQIHGGGSGGAIYIVHFTEQEVLGIIRMQLEDAGLRFTPPAPSYRSTILTTPVGVSLFDRGTNVAIATVDLSRWFWLNRIQADFESQHPDIAFGVFRQPAMNVEFCIEEFNEERAVAELANKEEEIREQFEADITRQVEQFIERLREEGRL